MRPEAVARAATGERTLQTRGSLMTSLRQRFKTTLVLLGFASILSANVGAQCPTYLTQWGSPGSGSGQFDNPNGIAIDAAGDVYVADTYNHRIQKFAATGAYLTEWGSLGNGNGQFNHPYGVAI